MRKNRFVFLLITILILTIFQPVMADSHSADEITLTVTPEKALVSEKIEMSVKAPGAEKIEIFSYSNDLESNKYLFESVNGDSFILRFTYGKPVQLSLTARACFDGVWTEETAPVTLEVTSKGQLVEVKADVPASIPMGEKLLISFDPVENADHYSYCYTSADKSCNSYYQILNDIIYIDVSAEEPGSYKLVIQASGVGWDTSHAAYSFEITDSGLVRPEAPTVSIDPSVTEFPVNKSIRFYLNAPQAEMIRYIAYDPDDCYERLEDHSYEYDGSSNTYWFSPSKAGAYTLEFSVMINGVWSNYSDPVSFTAVSYGALETPIVSYPTQINAGEELPVTITVGENVTSYSIDIYDQNGLYITSTSVTPYGETSVLKNIPMTGYEEGTYRLSVSAHADGFLSARLDGHTFEITGTLTPAPEVPPGTLPGDMDGNGVVNALDVLLLRDYFLKRGIGVEIKGNPDVDLSGTVNALDVLLLRDYFLKRGVGVVIY
ncbi:MAG: hypothetical protein IJI41_02365 [Anaerolineaceae bacterium]|nr:hypothetical protein [Anaerolineaceae bacterium]